MTQEKVQALNKILKALIPHWDMAEWFLILLQEEWNDELIERIYERIIIEIKSINSKKKRKDIKKDLKKLKEKEEKENKKNDEYLEDLINNI